MSEHKRLCSMCGKRPIRNSDHFCSMLCADAAYNIVEGQAQSAAQVAGRNQELGLQLAAERTRADEAERALDESRLGAALFDDIVAKQEERAAVAEYKVKEQRVVIGQLERLAAERSGLVEQAISCLRMGRYTQMADELRAALEEAGVTASPAGPDRQRGIMLALIEYADHAVVCSSPDGPCDCGYDLAKQRYDAATNGEERPSPDDDVSDFDVDQRLVAPPPKNVRRYRATITRQDAPQEPASPERGGDGVSWCQCDSPPVSFGFCRQCGLPRAATRADSADAES